MESRTTRTGAAAVAAGVLSIVGVEGEWLWDAQLHDGTVTDLPALAVLMGAAAGGFGLLLTAVWGLRGLVGRFTRGARAGSAMTVAGAVLVVAFGLVALVSLLVTGSPLEASFLAFLLGLLLLSVGTVTWGIALRRRSPAPGVWQLLVLSGVAAFGALAIEPDPWHDIALVVVFAAWSALGVVLLRARTDRAAEHHGDAGRRVSA